MQGNEKMTVNIVLILKYIILIKLLQKYYNNITNRLNFINRLQNESE